MLQAWGIDTLEWFEKPSGRRTLGAAVSIALVLAIAVLVWEVASNAVDRYLTTQHREGIDLHRGGDSGLCYHCCARRCSFFSA